MTDITLKGGYTTADPRLDAVPFKDPQSRDYPIMARVEAKKPRSYTWRCPITLDQGREGACVGFAWAHEAAARPVEVKGMTNTVAIDFYHEFQRRDPWEGGAYPGASPRYDGTANITGAKVMKEKGYLEEYRWGFSIDDLIMGVGYEGPAVVVVPWYDSMYETHPHGKQQWVTVSGTKVGYHCILVNGIALKQDAAKWHNSWGPTYGDNGGAYISFADLEALLKDDGEVCFPIGRARP